MNRLGEAISPYLLQHADNPVDWWPWCAEAFAEARRRDVPVLISVGYSACHWCHVLAHESFADPEVGRQINEGFVAIKVDREERPDVDAVYMTATQAMTGRGGWPLTVFADPDGRPFYCGTYFPRPAFVRLLGSVSQAWREQRDAVHRQGAAIVEAIGAVAAPPSTADPIGPELLDAAAEQLAREYDSVHGGFGGGPGAKFPPHLTLLFLLRHHQRTGDDRALEMVRHTAEAMARGGLYDQLAGGFARYTVDNRWVVPHFEKMLYDNALLLRVYTQLWRLTGDRLAGRVADEVAAFLLADEGFGLADGGFAASLDADTAGVEGATYVWTPAQLREVLGPDDGDWAADLFDVTATGSFEHGTSVLRLARDIDGAAPELARRWRRVRTALLAARSGRPQPGRDTKVVAAWTGLAITALVGYAAVRAGADPAELVDPGLPAGAAARAVRAGDYLARVHLVDGRLRRVSRDGVVGAPAAVLEDHGALAEAYCALHQLTGQGRWLELAGRLLDTALARFATGTGGLFDTADDAEALVTRPADPTDNATPSGLSTMVAALTSYAALTGSAAHRAAALDALGTVEPVLAGHARFTGYACAAGEALVSGPYQIAVATAGPAGPVGSAGSADPAGSAGFAGPADPAGSAGSAGSADPVGSAGSAGSADPVGSADPLVRAAWRLRPPGAVVVAGEPDRPGVPLLAGRPLTEGRATAYVCRGFVCDRPVTSVAELTGQLSTAP